MKKVLIPIIMIAILLLTACGSGGGFDPDTAAEDSKEKLKDFFALYDNEQELTTLKSKDIKKLVEENMIDFFTEKYIDDVYQAIDNRKSFNNSYQDESAFFLKTIPEKKVTVFLNRFEITDFRVKNKEEKVLIRIDSTEATLRDSALKIEMVIKDDEWKINGVN